MGEGDFLSSEFEMKSSKSNPFKPSSVKRSGSSLNVKLYSYCPPLSVDWFERAWMAVGIESCR